MEWAETPACGESRRSTETPDPVVTAPAPYSAMVFAMARNSPFFLRKFLALVSSNERPDSRLIRLRKAHFALFRPSE